MDTDLPFGLHSAPKIFSAVADAFAWAMHCRGIQWQLHYLDDFLFAGPANDLCCAQALRKLCRPARSWGCRWPHKVEGPATQLTFLGIQIDSVANELSLPPAKLDPIRGTVGAWLKQKLATKRELQSLVGLFHHAATAVPPGRTFLRQLIDMSKRGNRPRHFTHLNMLVHFDSQ